MSLRKSPTLTPALLAANRRNATKSTGPRTAQGKAWSRLNGLRYGRRSHHYMGFINALMDAPPGMVNVVAQRLLAEDVRGPSHVCGHRQRCHHRGARDVRGRAAGPEDREKISDDVRSRNLYETKGPGNRNFARTR